MLMNGLTKGALMLVLGAVFTWALVHAFEHRAREQAAASSAALSSLSITHSAGIKGPGRFNF